MVAYTLASRKKRARHCFTLSYNWTKAALQHAGLVSRAPPRRASPPTPTQALRRHDAAPEPAPAKAADGSRHEWLASQPPLDLIVTLDDATSKIYSAFLVEEEGTASTFRALKQAFAANLSPAEPRFRGSAQTGQAVAYPAIVDLVRTRKRCRKPLRRVSACSAV